MMGAVMGAGGVKWSGIWRQSMFSSNQGKSIYIMSKRIFSQTHLLLFGSSVESGGVVPAVLRS